MRSLYIGFFVGLYLISNGQTETKLLDKFAKDVCECIENTDSKTLIDNSEATKTNCMQEGLDLNVDELLELYGSDFIDDGELSRHISDALSKRLSTDCEIYAGLNKQTNGEQGYNPKQAELIGELTNWACNCSNEKLRANPNQSFQDVLESCMQSAVMENTGKLTYAFSNSILSDENLAYNIGVDIGRKLVMECDVFVPGIVTPIENAIKSQSTIGKIVGSNDGDYLSLSVENSSEIKSEYYVASAFEGSKEFLSQLNELRNNETLITIYFIEDDLFFKSENADKSVFRIETVNY